MLAAKLLEEGDDWNYPFHLGVTEAGLGTDGRIKSAVGIGALLADGIGDTIRVSLSEDSIHELPVCRDLLQIVSMVTEGRELEHLNPDWDPYSYSRRESTEITIENSKLGGVQPVRVFMTEKQFAGADKVELAKNNITCEVVYHPREIIQVKIGEKLPEIPPSALVTIEDNTDVPVISAFRWLASALRIVGQRNPILLKDTFNPQDEYAQGQEALEAQNFSKQIEDEDKKVTTIYERDPNYQNSFAQNAQGTEPSLQEPYAAFRENDNLSYGKENKDFKPHLNEPYQTELPLDSQGFGAQDNVPAQGFGASDLQNYQNFRAQEPQGAAEFGSQENPYAQKSIQEPSDFVNPQDRAYEREAFSQGQYAGVNDNYKTQDNASFAAQNAYAPHNLEDFKEDDVFGKLSFAEQNARNRDLSQESGKEEPSSTIITRHSPQESFNERVELKPNADEPAYITPGVRGAFKPKVEAEKTNNKKLTVE